MNERVGNICRFKPRISESCSRLLVLCGRPQLLARMKVRSCQHMLAEQWSCVLAQSSHDLSLEHAGTSKGFGFASFTSRAHAKKGIKLINGKVSTQFSGVTNEVNTADEDCNTRHDGFLDLPAEVQRSNDSS